MMVNPRVKSVKPNPDYTLTLTFTDGEIRIFDVKPYLDKGIFRELRDMSVFNSVKPFLGSIQWQGGQDFCPDTLYLEGTKQQDAAATEHSSTGRNLQIKGQIG
jgi:hypothetical protein